MELWIIIAVLVILAFAVLNGNLAKAKGIPNVEFSVILSILGFGLFVYLYLLAVPSKK